ncbi:F0F1 ATP synthase subunit B [Candidatus Sumerlaeota bacterium]|nr:F0F1 ATP synthase subunit B [Candidatus Sumerlaeota bacterium]
MLTTLIIGAAAGELVAQMATVILAFAIVVAILYKVAWGPIMQLIDERRETIAREFDTIEKKQAALDSRIRDYEERLRQIDNEARERLNRAIEEGRKASADLLEQARKQSDDLRKKAESDIRVEIEKARVELRDRIVDMTLQSTEKLLHKKLDAQAHRDLIGNFISEVEQKQLS